MRWINHRDSAGDMPSLIAIRLLRAAIHNCNWDCNSFEYLRNSRGRIVPSLAILETFGSTKCSLWHPKTQTLTSNAFVQLHIYRKFCLFRSFHEPHPIPNDSPSQQCVCKLEFIFSYLFNPGLMFSPFCSFYIYNILIIIIWGNQRSLCSVGCIPSAVCCL